MMSPDGIASRKRLTDWLTLQGARATWAKKVSSQITIECYIIRTRVVLVQLYAHGGWDLYTAAGAHTTDIGATLAQAERRLALSATELRPAAKS